jgi:hypothetical protein
MVKYYYYSINNKATGDNPGKKTVPKKIFGTAYLIVI